MKKIKNNKILKSCAVVALSFSFVFSGLAGFFSVKNSKDEYTANASIMSDNFNIEPTATADILPFLPNSTSSSNYIGNNIRNQLQMDRIKILTALQWRATSFPDFAEASPLTTIEQLNVAEWPYNIEVLNTAIEYMGLSTDTGATVANGLSPTTLLGWYYKYNLKMDNTSFGTGSEFYYANMVYTLPEAEAYRTEKAIFDSNPTAPSAVDNLNIAITNLNIAIEALNEGNGVGFNYSDAVVVLAEKDAVDPVFNKYKRFVAKANARLSLVRADIQTKYQNYMKNANLPLEFILESDFYADGVLAQDKATVEAMIQAEDAWRYTYLHYDDSGNTITDVNVKNKRSFIDTNYESIDETTGLPYDLPDGSDLSQFSKLNEILKTCSNRYYGLKEYYEKIDGFKAQVAALKPIMQLTTTDKTDVNAAYTALNSFKTKYERYITGENNLRINTIKDLLTIVELKQKRIYQLEKNDPENSYTWVIIMLSILGFAILGGAAYLYIALKGKEQKQNLLGTIKPSQINGGDVVDETVLETKRQIEEERKKKIKADIDFD